MLNKEFRMKKKPEKALKVKNLTNKKTFKTLTMKQMMKTSSNNSTAITIILF